MRMFIWLIFLATLLLATIVFAEFGSFGWFEMFVANRTFPMTFGWIEWGQLITWGFYIALFFALGLLIASISNSRRGLWWALAFGCIYGLVLFYRSHDGFSKNATLLTHVWAYGRYFMPVVGAVAGAATRFVASLPKARAA